MAKKKFREIFLSSLCNNVWVLRFEEDLKNSFFFLNMAENAHVVTHTILVQYSIDMHSEKRY